ncbi:hypothetical protein [Streptomyces sp. NPDC048560]|uniref:hypothetical protein n=1 Tax=Streptomyces sp. NPDC048560 TaxID=3155488 RepID=UPI0034372730
MNTILNYAVVAALFALVLLPSLAGLARERRIDQALRAAERNQAGPPEAEGAARPVTVARRPSIGSWARV